VGLHLDLPAFTFDQVQELNDRYGKPFANVDQLVWLYELVEGHPFLTRRALEFLMRSNSLSKLKELACSDDGPFGDHLKRVLVSVSQLEGVLIAMRNSLTNVVLADSRDVQRLLAAGILVRRSSSNYEVRTKLYREYLSKRLGSMPSTSGSQRP
jgi:hypothetical protein